MCPLTGISPYFLLSGAQVGGDEGGVTSGRPDVGDDGAAAGLVPSADDDESTAGGQGLRDGNSKASGGTGDQRCAARQPRIVWTRESTYCAFKNGPASP
jgi:hypothetical protein